MPTVALFSDPNFFSIALIEQLLAKMCKVAVFTKNKKLFNEKTRHITNKTNFSILEEKDFSSYGKVSYAIFISGFISKNDSYSVFSTLYRSYDLTGVKCLAIFPAEIFDYNVNSKLPTNSDLGVVYLGDLLGPRLDRESDLTINRTLLGSLNEGKFRIGVGELFYPLLASSAAREVVKWIFSFGPYGKEIFLVGDQVTPEELWGSLGKYIQGIELNYDSRLNARSLAKGFEKKVIQENPQAIIRETIPWLLKPNKQKPKIFKKDHSFVNLRKRPFIIFLVTIFLLPVFLLLISALLYFVSFKSYLSGRPGVAQGAIVFAKFPSVVAREESRFLKYIPGLGIIYRETFFLGDIGSYLSDIGMKAIPLASSSKDLVTKILGDEIYDPSKYSNDISLELGDLGNKLAEFQADVSYQKKSGSILAKKLDAIVDISRLSQISQGTSKLVSNLPQILGKEGRKTYLVLFENNMELRPTGGFIGSFGLLTFEGGRMTDLSISDVYSADGQLKGHIEPPLPIKSYLGEANWWFRDSNWDPDFPTSAKRAEWFLDKEIDRQVDGVVAVDLYPIKEALNYTGPIYLADYNMDITSTNLYEKTQAEAHEDFFPGTHQKASFLTALSRNLISQVGQMGSRGKIGILRVLLSSLEGRHLQLYLHEDKSQNTISALNWAGEVKIPTCLNSCYPDFVGLIEANLGVNKANYFVTRDQELQVNIANGQIKRQLTITFINSANPALGENARYKNYLRILLPSDANVEGIVEVTGQDNTALTPDIYAVRDHKEVGVITELLAGQTKKIVLSWVSQEPTGFDKEGEYNLYIRKQAGTPNSDKLSVSIIAPGGPYLYNTPLAKDFFSKVLWTNKH